MDNYLTPAAVAQRLRLHTRTLMRKRQDGSGPAYMKIGSRVLYRLDEIDKWLAANTYRHRAEELVRKAGMSRG